MINLYVDNTLVEIDSLSIFSVSISKNALKSIEYGRIYSIEPFSIPATSLNRSVMGDVEQIHSPQIFNSVEHKARVECNGSIIMEGLLQLLGSDLSGEGRYKCTIIGADKNWVSRTNLVLGALNINYRATITPLQIKNSWTDNNPVRFFPVIRNTNDNSIGNIGLSPVSKALTMTDYHPFVHIKTLVNAIFQQSGHTIESSFMESDFFDSLYMSGNYRTKDVSRLKNQMDFRAGRYADSVVALADSNGRVYADPLSHYNTIGNLVDTANPQTVNADGLSVPGVFTNENCFSHNGTRVCFTPDEEITVSFEYKIRYLTDTKIVSKTELGGFNTIYLNSGEKHSFKINNDYRDRKNFMYGGQSYKLAIFNHTQGSSYRLKGNEVTNPNANLNNLLPSDYVTRIIGYSDARFKSVSYNSQNRFVNMKLDILKNNVYTSYSGDWAIYDGYVNESGQKEIEITLRSAPEIISPSNPKYFDNVYFEGANQNDSFKLRSNTTVCPIFVPHPTVSSTINFNDVIVHSTSQKDLLESLRLMFNLYFYTDPLEKIVYIEPQKEFYTSNIVDLSDRIDLSKPIMVEELGANLTESVKFCYDESDQATKVWNTANNTELGAWSVAIDNVFAEKREKIYKNPSFATSLVSQKLLKNAPSARVIQAAKHISSIYKNDDLNFDTKIVSYKGMVNLPSGESWSWPSDGTQFPLIAFHYPYSDFCDPFTLCYENRDGIEGLHKYWDFDFENSNSSRRIILYINLEPEEIEPLIFPNSLKRDFRAVFLLDINGEKCRCRLQEICGFNPLSQSTKCVFIKI